MLIRIVKTLFVLFCLVLLGYLVLPNPDFPKPPPDALQSKEPGDTETALRRAYFTDYTREEVLSWYEGQFMHSSYLEVPMPTYLLNYPPEDAQTIIRDQTRSTFLQEIVHPMRESIYINGFQATSGKDTIFIEGRKFRQKITVRYIPSSLGIRVEILVGVIILSIVLFISWKFTLKDLTKTRLKIW